MGSSAATDHASRFGGFHHRCPSARLPSGDSHGLRQCGRTSIDEVPCTPRVRISKLHCACLATASPINAAIEPPLTSNPMLSGGKTDDLLKPVDYLVFDVDGRLISASTARVHRCPQCVREVSQHDGRRIYPPLTPRMAVSERGRFDIPSKSGENVVCLLT
jgi:hypothetical protein